MGDTQVLRPSMAEAIHHRDRFLTISVSLVLLSQRHCKEHARKSQREGQGRHESNEDDVLIIHFVNNWVSS